MLFTVCTLDLVSSAWLFHYGLATEQNPLLRKVAEAGTVPFVLAKLSSYLPALVAAEWYRRSHPRRAARLLRLVIGAYLVIYFFGVASQFFP